MADENLRIRISAIDNTRKAFGAVTKGLGAIKSAVFSAKSAIVALVGAGGIGYLIKSSLNAGDQLAKTARKIGTTTEALSRLRYAADLSGVSTQTLDMAMQRFTRRTAEAARGTGEAKDALRELGLDAKALLKLPLEQRMSVLADAFTNVGTSADQVRLAMKLFDSEGVALVNMLNSGSVALNDMMKEADTLGIVLSATAAKGAEQANDELGKLFKLVTGLKLQFSAALAPAIKIAAEKLREFALETANGNIAQLGKAMAVSFIDGTIATVQALAKVKGTIAGILNMFTGDLSLMDKAQMYAQIAYLKTQRALIDGIIQRGKDDTGNRQKYLDITQKIFDLEMKLNGQNLFDESGDAGGITAFLKGLRDQTQNFQLPSLVPDAMEEVNVVAQKTMPNFSDVLAETKEKAKELKDSLFDVSADAAGLVTNGVDTLTNGLMDLMTGAKNASQAFKSMASSIVQDLMRMYLKYMIVQPLFNALFPNAVQTPAGGGVPAVTGSNANGGSVSAGQPRLVGEHGPEYFVPRSNGAVIANRDLQGGGGVTVNQSINISTGVAQTVRAEIMGLMPQITNATKAAVADARMRGGSFSKSLVGA